MDSNTVRGVRRALLRWFDAHKRELPWRKNRDPYAVWISEIMLQQTRVAAVIRYYEKFMARFPDVFTLARARESSVLAAWSGLGYYRRARALHAAAKCVASKRGGAFPGTSDELQKLPGIGRYTAAAVASIAFGERCAVVDGNVERVLTRIIGKPYAGEQTWRAANSLLAPLRPGDFNEAMMELGATICTPKDPACGQCPIYRWCCTKGVHDTTAQEQRVRRLIGYILSVRNGRVYLVRRAASATLMPSMWELPEAQADVEGECMFLKHSITNTDYYVRVVSGIPPNGVCGEWIRSAQAARMPLTGLARKILKRSGFI